MARFYILVAGIIVSVLGSEGAWARQSLSCRTDDQRTTIVMEIKLNTIPKEVSQLAALVEILSPPVFMNEKVHRAEALYGSQDKYGTEKFLNEVGFTYLSAYTLNTGMGQQFVLKIKSEYMSSESGGEFKAELFNTPLSLTNWAGWYATCTRKVQD